MTFKNILITITILSFFLLTGCTNYDSPFPVEETPSDYDQIIELLDSIPVPNDYIVKFYQEGYECSNRYCGQPTIFDEVNGVFKIKNQEVISEIPVVATYMVMTYNDGNITKQKNITTYTISEIISDVREIVDRRKNKVDRFNASHVQLTDSYEQDGCYLIKELFSPSGDGPSPDNHYIDLCYQDDLLKEVNITHEINLHYSGPKPNTNWKISY